MAFGTIPLPSFESSVDSGAHSETVVRPEWNQDLFEQAWERLDDCVRAVTADREAFMRLEQGIPLEFVVAVNDFARFCGPSANAYLEQTRALRLRMTEFEYLCTRQEPLFVSEERNRLQHETVEHIFDMLRDPGYARLILQEMALRETARTGEAALARAYGVLPPKGEELEMTEEEQARQARFAYLLAHKGKVPRHRDPTFSSEASVEQLFPDVDREIQSSFPTGRGRAVGYTRSIEHASTLAELQGSLVSKRGELTPPSQKGTG